LQVDADAASATSFALQRHAQAGRRSPAPAKSRDFTEVAATSIIFGRPFPIAEYHFRWH